MRRILLISFAAVIVAGGFALAAWGEEREGRRGQPEARLKALGGIVLDLGGIAASTSVEHGTWVDPVSGEIAVHADGAHGIQVSGPMGGVGVMTGDGLTIGNIGSVEVDYDCDLTIDGTGKLIHNAPHSKTGEEAHYNAADGITDIWCDRYGHVYWAGRRGKTGPSQSVVPGGGHSRRAGGDRRHKPVLVHVSVYDGRRPASRLEARLADAANERLALAYRLLGPGRVVGDAKPRGAEGLEDGAADGHEPARVSVLVIFTLGAGVARGDDVAPAQVAVQIELESGQPGQEVAVDLEQDLLMRAPEKVHASGVSGAHDVQPVHEVNAADCAASRFGQEPGR